MYIIYIILESHDSKYTDVKLLKSVHFTHIIYISQNKTDYVEANVYKKANVYKNDNSSEFGRLKHTIYVYMLLLEVVCYDGKICEDR